MLWKKYALIILLGLFLGSVGQLVFDVFFTHCLKHNGKIQNVTIFQIISENEIKAASYKDSRAHVFYAKVRPLLLQGLFWCWLAERGSDAFRTAIFSALACIAVIQMKEHFFRSRIPKAPEC